ncbi:MAG: hypothetical protein OXF30_01155 [Candidatus Saccharibacteria bacterium]|nr:hypothetical protein [Candidatus Saccharibacteria bacterium]
MRKKLFRSQFKQMIQAGEKRFREIVEDPRRLVDEYQKQQEDAIPSVLKFESLFYYRGKNIAKKIGRLILRTEYHVFFLSSEKNNLKPIIEDNQQLRDARDSWTDEKKKSPNK